MGMISRWSKSAKGGQESERQSEPSPAARPSVSSAPAAGGIYSLQGEDDLFRDPFADFTPSSR